MGQKMGQKMVHSDTLTDAFENSACKCLKVEYEDARNRMTKSEKDEVKQYRKELYDDFKNNITIHGYRQLTTETGWRKVSWIIVMTLLTSFAVYLSYHMLLDFGYQTVLEYENEDVGSHLNYPSITICSNSPVFSEVSFRNFPLNVTKDEFRLFYLEELSSVNYMHNTSKSSQRILEQLNALNYTTYKSILKLFENTIYDSTDVWTQFVNGPTCYLGDKSCDFEKDFKETLHWKYSLCHQWNYYDLNKTAKRQTSNDETLTILLNIHADYKLISYYPFYGIVLYIHPYGTPHYLAEHTESMGLQTGKFTTVDIELTEVNLLPIPYSNGCGTKKLAIIKNFPYSRALCEVDCILQRIYEKCGCVGFEFEGQVGDVKICEVKQMTCYYKYLNEYKNSCIKYASTCPRECTYYKYHFQSSLIMNLGDEIMYQGFQNISGWKKNRDQTEKYIRQNLLGIEIGYKSLSKLKENYKPSVTFSALIGTVGGSIGVCLGFSFVTCYEVVFFIYDYLTAWWKLKDNSGVI